MNNIILINPKFASPIGRFGMPLGILYVGTYLESKGYTVKIIDSNVEDNYIDLIKKEIQNSLCFGISAMTDQIANTIFICEVIKEIDPSVPIILGGAHPTLSPKQTIQESLVDYAVIGEGEDSTYNLIRALEGKETLTSVEGIAFKDRGNIKINPKIKLFDPNDLPSINFNLLSKKILKKFESASLSTSRGCPHRCKFCINTTIKEYTHWRGWEPNRVLAEIEKLLNLGVKRIWFYDDNFFVNKKRVEQITEGIIQKDLKFKWSAELRCDYFNSDFVNIDLLEKAKKAGCINLAFGAESGSQKILDYLHKDVTIEQIHTSAKMCCKVGITPTYSFLIGVPTETKDDVEQTINLIRKLVKLCPESKFLGPQLLRLFPGTELYQDCLSLGWKEPQSLREWSKKISSEFMFSTPFEMPWINDPEFVNIIWFYSLLLMLDYKDTLNLYRRVYYSDTNSLKNNLSFLANAINMILLASLGKSRYSLGYFKYPIETKILRKFRAQLSC